MDVQVLISAVNKEPKKLIEEMNIQSDALLVNQCREYSYEEWENKGRKIRAFSMAERGVGLSRNTAMMRADGDICLFSDQDIVLEPGYEEKISGEFEKNPRADMLIFNIEIGKERKTYENKTRKRVHLYNCGRYGAVGFAVRRESLLASGITFSLLFGGGARFSNGEDSLFLKEFIRKGYRVYTVPVVIGRETGTESTWFTGYHEKFFFDRGVLYSFLYGKMACAMAVRFLLAHREKMCRELSFRDAFQKMKEGIREGSRQKKGIR